MGKYWNMKCNHTPQCVMVDEDHCDDCGYCEYHCECSDSEPFDGVRDADGELRHAAFCRCRECS
jgi:hypothetical protein